MDVVAVPQLCDGSLVWWSWLGEQRGEFLEIAFVSGWCDKEEHPGWGRPVVRKGVRESRGYEHEAARAAANDLGAGVRFPGAPVASRLDARFEGEQVGSPSRM